MRIFSIIFDLLVRIYESIFIKKVDSDIKGVIQVEPEVKKLPEVKIESELLDKVNKKIMTTKEFVTNNYPFALQVEAETGISALAIMAQAALESDWGKKAIGFNIFGIKFRGVGKSQRALTTEYDEDEFAYPEEDVVSKVYLKKEGKWFFRVYRLFQDYDSVKEAFDAHAKVLLHKRYESAFKFKDDPVKFLQEVWKCGYATDVHYGEKMKGMVDSIKRRL